MLLSVTNVGTSQWQGHEAAGHIGSEVRKQSDGVGSWLSFSFHSLWISACGVGVSFILRENPLTDTPQLFPR